MINFKLPVLDHNNAPVCGAYFILLISDDPRQLFKYFNIDKMHGLNLIDCEQRLKEGGSYIDGLCNLTPNNFSVPHFIFLNLKTMNQQKIWETATLIMHESMHLSIHFENIFSKEIEEENIQRGENIANLIMKTLDFPELYFFINTTKLWQKKFLKN